MVYVLLAEGFEEGEALIPVDLLRRAGVDVKLVGIDSLKVTGCNGITVCADMLITDAKHENMEMLFIPGGTAGVANIQSNLFAMAFIQKAEVDGKWLAAICAAPTILAHIGITDRRSAVCYPTCHKFMGSAVIPDDKRVVRDGRIITAEALGVVFEFALELISVLKGKEMADDVGSKTRFLV